MADSRVLAWPTGPRAGRIWRASIRHFCLLSLGLLLSSAHALETLGWEGFVTGCGTTMYWTVGGFNRAKSVQDACRQAGENHARRPGGRALAVSGSTGDLLNYVKARCYFEPDRQCGLIQASPQCPAGSDFVLEAEACFCGRTTKEDGGKCVPGIDCDEMVRRLKQLKIPPEDPRHGFYRNQTCIAEKACAARTSMENQGWLNKVVPAFVNPLLNQDGIWKRIMDTCKTKRPLGKFQCQDEMADYHIKKDLQSALNAEGCGTDADWRDVGNIIAECVSKGVQDDLTPALQAVGTTLASYAVQASRDQVRVECLKQRSKNER